jgi:hypothetical protein
VFESGRHHRDLLGHHPVSPVYKAHLGLLELPDQQVLEGKKERLENLAYQGPTGHLESRGSKGFQENGVLKARLDLLDRLDPPEHNQFNLPMDPSLLRAHRARQVHPVHEDQPGFQELKGHRGLRECQGGTDLQALPAVAVSEARTGYLVVLGLRDRLDYRALVEAAAQLTSDGETRRVPRPQEPNLFTLAELLVVIGAAPGELAIFFVYPRNPSTMRSSSLGHNATLRCTGWSTRRSTARL